MKMLAAKTNSSILKSFRRFNPAVLIAATLLLLVDVSAQSGGAGVNKTAFNERIKLTKVENWAGVQSYCLSDFDGDGIDDLFRLYDGHRTYHVNRFCRERVLGPALYQGNALYQISEVCPVDIDTIPGYEIALIMKDPSGDSLWVEVYQGAEKNLLCRTEAVIGQDRSPINPGWDGGASFCYASDLDDDGRMELVLPLSVGHDLYPRGIYVYEYPSGRLKWWFPLAGNPLRLTIADVNRDGFQEIYVKTFACCNGAVVGNRVDTLAYIHALDHLGNILWSHTLGDRFDLQTGEPHICDCDGDGVIEIYYTMLLLSDEFDQNVWTLQKRRAKDNFFLTQLSFGAGQGFSQIYSGNFGENGQVRLLTDMNPCLIDPKTLVIHKCGPIKNGRILGIENLDARDNRSEIILTQRDSLYICDADLEVIGALALENRTISKANYLETPFGDRYLLALSAMPGQLSANSLDVYRIDYVSEPFAGISWTQFQALLGGVAIGLIPGAFIGYWVVRRRRPKVRRRISTTAQYSNLLTSLAAFDHGQMAGKNLNRLLFLFSNLPESPEKLDEIKPNLTSAIEAYRSFTSSQLQNIIDNAWRLRPIKAFVARLAEQSQKLSGYLDRLNVMELEIGSAGELKKSVPAVINAVKEAIGQIRSYLQTHFSSNLLRVIPDVLSAVAGHFQQHGIGFSEIRTRGGTGQLVFFDETTLAAVLEELLNNACDAMGQSEKKDLILDITFDSNEVAIRLSDSGHGLQAGEIEQIFNRNYSSRGPERGYGLFHARHQVERFGGRIRLYNNNPPPGATVELILKTVNHG